MIFDINHEWNFIAEKIHSQSFSRVGLRKKNILFVMQIVLGKISSTLNKKEKCITRGAYLRLKDTIKIKLSEKYDINGHIVWEK